MDALTCSRCGAPLPESRDSAREGMAREAARAFLWLFVEPHGLRSSIPHTGRDTVNTLPLEGSTPQLPAARRIVRGDFALAGDEDVVPVDD